MYQQKVLDIGNKMNVGIELKVLGSKVMGVISLQWNLHSPLTAENWCPHVTSAIWRRLLVCQILRLHLHIYLT